MLNLLFFPLLSLPPLNLNKPLVCLFSINILITNFYLKKKKKKNLKTSQSADSALNAREVVLVLFF